MHEEKQKSEFDKFYEKLSINITVVDDFPYVAANDPAFKKKADDAREFLRKHPIPKSMLKNSK